MTEAMAIRVRETGGIENMRAEKITLPPPGAGEALVRNRAVGVNFIDVYHRSGLYPAAAPFVLGMEGAGVVEAVGEGGGGWRPGARVGYCVGGMGAYADCRLIKTDALIPLPDDLPFEEAAAVLLKGMTAEYLIRRVYRVRRGDSVLFHAAAGGVGLVACQWLKQLGATVIGTVGGEKKADIAKANGCDNVILYNREDVAARARELTGGIGVPVAYDSVGRATFRATLESLAPRGMFVSFGNASGAVEPFAPLLLAQHGSLFFTRPTLMAYCPPGPDMRASAEALFAAIKNGLRVHIGRRLPLSEAAEAHRALENRETIGATILIPN